jgi:hypothetical protein
MKKSKNQSHELGIFCRHVVRVELAGWKCGDEIAFQSSNLQLQLLMIKQRNEEIKAYKLPKELKQGTNR